MSERQHYIRSSVPADQNLTARAIKQLASWLDLADDHAMTTVYPEAVNGPDGQENAYAWMWAALLIADMGDVDSGKLNYLANSIACEVQGEFLG